MGYKFIGLLKSYGLKVFADLKLIDILATLENDGAFLEYEKPDLLTVMCAAGTEGMRALANALPSTEVLGVTVLTSLNHTDCRAIHGGDIQESALRLAKLAEDAPIQGLISSPAEVPIFKQHLQLPMTYNTPGIRPEWSVVAGDDQNPERIMTPRKAIEAGATRIVVGRPITTAKNPLEAVKRTIDEIAAALDTLATS